MTKIEKKNLKVFKKIQNIYKTYHNNEMRFFYYIRPYFLAYFVKTLAKHFCFYFTRNLINILIINKIESKNINIIISFFRYFLLKMLIIF